MCLRRHCCEGLWTEVNRKEARLTATDMDLQYQSLSKPVEGYGMKDTTYERTE